MAPTLPLMVRWHRQRKCLRRHLLRRTSLLGQLRASGKRLQEVAAWMTGLVPPLHPESLLLRPRRRTRGSSKGATRRRLRVVVILFQGRRAGSTPCLLRSKSGSQRRSGGLSRRLPLRIRLVSLYAQRVSSELQPRPSRSQRRPRETHLRR